MGDKNNELIINVAKLFGILTEMRKTMDEETILKIIEIAQSSLSGETLLQTNNKKEESFDSKSTSTANNESDNIINPSPDRVDNEISLEDDKTSTPLIYDPKDYSKVKEDNELSSKEENFGVPEIESSSDDIYYSISNKDAEENIEIDGGNKGYVRTLTPPFTTGSYQENTTPYQEEMPLDNDNVQSIESRNSVVDWSNASLVKPGQTFSNLR